MKKILAVLFVATTVGSHAANATDRPETRNGGAAYLTESRNVLAPLQFVKFCMNYPSDCQPSSGEAALPARDEAYQTLEDINDRVNRSIEPMVKSSEPLLARWTISPSAGDCNDYAVTKRNLLLAKGWPANSLRLAVVFAPAGGHLVLVARLQDADYVLDNLVNSVKPWSQVDYTWVSMQSGENPRFWIAIGGPGSFELQHNVASISQNTN